MDPSHRTASAIPLALAVLLGAATTTATTAQEPAPALTGGLRGFESFHEPLGQPLYFETPFNDTGFRALFLKHSFSDDSTMAGGDVAIYALQLRYAITERLGLIATKDGYSVLDSGIIEQEGWNDLAAGLKYALIADRDSRFVLTPGVRYQAENGDRDILQGRVDELSPFVSVAKGFDRLHLLGNATLRLPFDSDEGNTVGHWDLHADFDVNPDSSAVFAPLLEVHGVHYLSDGDLALDVGGLDYTNLGSQPATSFVAWAGIGARLEIDHRYELGICYEFALTDPDDDLMEDRITVDFCVRF